MDGHPVRWPASPAVRLERHDDLATFAMATGSIGPFGSRTRPQTPTPPRWRAHSTEQRPGPGVRGQRRPAEVGRYVGVYWGTSRAEWIHPGITCGPAGRAISRPLENLTSQYTSIGARAGLTTPPLNAPTTAASTTSSSPSIRPIVANGFSTRGPVCAEEGRRALGA